VPASSQSSLVRKLLGRLQAARRARRQRTTTWSGEYGTGAGRAHHSVEFAACPACKSAVGKLCVGPNGPKLATHYQRRAVYRRLVAELRAKVEP
jgi:hypothetical protein